MEKHSNKCVKRRDTEAAIDGKTLAFLVLVKTERSTENSATFEKAKG